MPKMTKQVQLFF